MTTTLQQPPGLLGIGMLGAAGESFDWHAHYITKQESFTATAQTWRNIAHTAQLDGNDDVVRMAHKNALENEMLAKDAAQQALLHQPR